MHPYIWGSFYWYFIHILAYHHNNLNLVKKFYNTILHDILPCDECKDNFKLFLKNNKIKCKTRNNIIKWTIDCHNYVNKKKHIKLLMGNMDDLYKDINYNKLEIFYNIIRKMYNKNKISKDSLDCIIQLFPNKIICNKLENNLNYKIPNKYLSHLLHFKINDDVYISLLPDTCKNLNKIKITYTKKNINLNINNLKLKINNTGKIKNIKLITTSMFDYLQRINKINNYKINYHII